MNITEIHALDYVLALFTEMVKRYDYSKAVSYEPIYLMDGKYAQLDSYRYENAPTHPLQASKSEPGIFTHISLNYQNDESTETFEAARHAFFRYFPEDQLQDKAHHLLQTNKDPEAVLTAALDIVSDIDSPVDDLPSTVYNVHFLETGLELPFLKLEKDVEITPISLLSKSSDGNA
ncbi:hypothetical protein [Furfurilactobacillus entadae]|uniref:hypothetical protein n=1 Tax=Furfurilactobacillus entadae TaxID=2922307 RepID=UPI0035EF644E